MRSHVVDLELFLARRTPQAIMVKEIEDSDGVWLTLSQVEVDGEIGQNGVVTLTEWLAKEKELS